MQISHQNKKNLFVITLLELSKLWSRGKRELEKGTENENVCFTYSQFQICYFTDPKTTAKVQRSPIRQLKKQIPHHTLRTTYTHTCCHLYILYRYGHGEHYKITSK